jgi:hypothetical protein
MGADLFGGDSVRVQEMNRATTLHRKEISGASRAGWKELDCHGERSSKP